MDTTRSERIVARFVEKEMKYERTTLEFTGTFDATPEELFPLLCPTREADWVEGWDCQLLYTESAYGEDKAIFSTDENCSGGPGLWMLTKYEPNRVAEFIRFMNNDVLQHSRMTVNDNADGTTSITWEATFTALTEKGNHVVNNIMGNSHVSSEAIVGMLKAYLKNPTTERSEKMASEFKNRSVHLRRAELQIGGTWEASPEDIFTLLCPAREADWLVDWDAEIIYSANGGYAEDRCVFRTDDANPSGSGIWAFTTFEKNKRVDFIRLQEDMLLHVRIDIVDNQDGTVSSYWHPTPTAITEKGNAEVAKLEAEVGKRGEALPKMIEHYLRTGKRISKAKLGLGIAAGLIKGSS